MSKKKHEPLSTLERWQQNLEFQREADKTYRELVLSELLLALMEEDEKSVRELAKEAGLSPTTIQKARSGKSKDMGIKNFLNVIEACGYSLVLEKNGKRIPLRPLLK
ncbi:MAG: hypothetical protein D6730_02190 [Bacteroidetes bacterium]|nr:MAG: hypothetical protein D6730_02190 [Bacteroidota bacterium]